MISGASPSSRRRPASARTLASLWRRLISASSGSWAFTARTPSTLLATIETPDARPADEHGAVGLAAGDQARGLGGVARVVGGLLRVGADVDDLVAGALEQRATCSFSA